MFSPRGRALAVRRGLVWSVGPGSVVAVDLLFVARLFVIAARR
jgi:hypothetical protein